MQGARFTSHGDEADAVELHLPFRGAWVTQMSPARRVPSHGTDLYGVRYAIDFVAVDERGRTASTTSWRTVLGTEPPDIFYAFGASVLSPVGGTVVAAMDDAEDHEARRSMGALAAYAVTQPNRIREGLVGLAGNHVVVRDATSGFEVLVGHLRRRSLRVRVGDVVTAGQEIAACGNSGNSTQPHVHLQVVDDHRRGRQAMGVPLRFRNFTARRKGDSAGRLVESGVPDEGTIVTPASSPLRRHDSSHRDARWTST